MIKGSANLKDEQGGMTLTACAFDAAVAITQKGKGIEEPTGADNKETQSKLVQQTNQQQDTEMEQGRRSKTSATGETSDASADGGATRRWA